jgi:hypothetical protein
MLAVTDSLGEDNEQMDNPFRENIEMIVEAKDAEIADLKAKLAKLETKTKALEEKSKSFGDSISFGDLEVEQIVKEGKDYVYHLTFGDKVTFISTSKGAPDNFFQMGNKYVLRVHRK